MELRGLEDHAELTVTDTGTGIPPEALPQLFDRFYRVPGANGRTHEGSGIGLSLARELVKLHGGTIEVESRQRAIDAGFDRHLTKPIDPDALEAILSQGDVSLRCEIR